MPFLNILKKVVAIGHSFGGYLALLSNADYCIAISPSVKWPLREHTRSMLKTRRSYHVQPSDFETVLVIHEELPNWNPSQNIENTLILFAEVRNRILLWYGIGD